MTFETLEEQIKKRADEQAQKAIWKFKNDVLTAATQLFHGDYMTFDTPDLKKLMECFGRGVVKGNMWPARIWKLREDKLRDEVLSTMDTVQRMLISKGGDGEHSPEEETSKES